MLVFGQPKTGTVEDQFPVIQIQGQYFTMSLRMMKAVWYGPAFRICIIYFAERESDPVWPGGACVCARGL